MVFVPLIQEKATISGVAHVHFLNLRLLSYRTTPKMPVFIVKGSL